MPTGTLVFPPQPRTRPHAHESSLIPNRHCELCATVFGKAECQRGQWSHLWVLTGADANGQVAFIGAAHFEGAELYAFSIIATLDSTMFNAPLITARTAYDHIHVVLNGHGHRQSSSPF